MGCDIHGWIEKRVGDKWVAHQPIKGVIYARDPDETETHWGRRLPVDDRNYRFFGYIAQVRHDHPDGMAPKGFPADACAECKEDYKNWDGDAHTSSHLLLEEAAPFWWKAMGEYSEGVFRTPWDKKFPCEKPFGIPIPDGQYRFVFWFDN